MATISTRVDDKMKADAEKIADEIGIPTGTAIIDINMLDASVM